MMKEIATVMSHYNLSWAKPSSRDSESAVTPACTWYPHVSAIHAQFQQVMTIAGLEVTVLVKIKGGQRYKVACLIASNRHAVAALFQLVVTFRQHTSAEGPIGILETATSMFL